MTPNVTVDPSVFFSNPDTTSVGTPFNSSSVKKILPYIYLSRYVCMILVRYVAYSLFVEVFLRKSESEKIVQITCNSR